MLFKTAIKATGRLAENIASVASVMQPMVMAALVLPIPYIYPLKSPIICIFCALCSNTQVCTIVVQYTYILFLKVADLTFFNPI